MPRGVQPVDGICFDGGTQRKKFENVNSSFTLLDFPNPRVRQRQTRSHLAHRQAAFLALFAKPARQRTISSRMDSFSIGRI